MTTSATICECRPFRKMSRLPGKPYELSLRELRPETFRPCRRIVYEPPRNSVSGLQHPLYQRWLSFSLFSISCRDFENSVCHRLTLLCHTPLEFSIGQLGI